MQSSKLECVLQHDLNDRASEVGNYAAIALYRLDACSL